MVFNEYISSFPLRNIEKILKSIQIRPILYSPQPIRLQIFFLVVDNTYISQERLSIFDTSKIKHRKIRENCNLLITVKYHKLEWSSPLIGIFFSDLLAVLRESQLYNFADDSTILQMIVPLRWKGIILMIF